MADDAPSVYVVTTLYGRPLAIFRHEEDAVAFVNEDQWGRDWWIVQGPWRVR
jgi:hypothetical protein